MPSSKEAVIFIVISLLVIGLIFSSSSSFYVFARPKINYGPVSCYFNSPHGGSLTCCQDQTDEQGIQITYCTVCNNVDQTGHPVNCGPRYIQGSVNPPSRQPPKNAPPPSTQQTTCPGGLAPDAKGNCPTTTNQQVAPSQSLGGPASNNNNPQPEHHHHKGQESTTKKDNGGSQQQSPP